MGKCTERGRVMLYSEFPTIFKEMRDGVKEGILEGVSGGAVNSASTASARLSEETICSPYPNKLWIQGICTILSQERLKNSQRQ